MSANDKAGYHHFARINQTIEELPDNVCQDLNIDNLFDKLDYTTSCVGRQYLYHLLCTDSPSEVAQHEDFIQILTKDTALRERLVQSLKQLNHPDAFSIVDLLAEQEYQYSRRYLFLLQVCRWLPLVCVVGMFLIPTSAIPFLLLLLAYIGNGILHFKEKNKLTNYYFSIPQLRKLLKLTSELVKVPAFTGIDKKIGETSHGLGTLQRKLTIFRFGIGLESEAAMLVYLLTELFNIFFLSGTINIVYSFIAIKDQKKEIESVFRFVGFLDTLCSLSFMRQNVPYWCFPTSPSAGKVCAKGLYHPLIKDCVSNDLALTERSMLITGSNMSGKTSFIRTVGINLLTGKTLNTCFAQRFEIDCCLRLYSVIHTEDDLLEGKSYFFKQAENVKSALMRGKEGGYLLIFDELFKGTNTLERIAINAAVFSQLATKENLILASTHDLKLADLLEQKYELYHFCETVSENNLRFDYKLKKGVVKEGNAIKILQLCGYPEDIIQASERIVSQPLLFQP